MSRNCPRTEGPGGQVPGAALPGHRDARRARETAYPGTECGSGRRVWKGAFLAHPLQSNPAPGAVARARPGEDAGDSPRIERAADLRAVALPWCPQRLPGPLSSWTPCDPSPEERLNEKRLS